MDDLTLIKGIGATSAKLLAGDGLASFAALAALDPADPPQVDGLRSPDWAAWIADAALRVAPTTEAENAPGGLIVVTGPKRGRWRAGYHFGPEPVTLKLDELTEDECAAIGKDPMLTTSIQSPPDR
ncbi:hypothetical protein [Pararhodobacter sp.]|uniref:hypothetical protein n=1 Tax=Pararhodobacter sp. TaxID=2127056 RepID=UPI002AFDE18E|nr:hypothetical protein [Pararhodobacter sp.]